MKALLLKFWNDESGETKIEFCLIAAGIALAIVATANSLGAAPNRVFTLIANALTR